MRLPRLKLRHWVMIGIVAALLVSGNQFDAGFKCAG